MKQRMVISLGNKVFKDNKMGSASGNDLSKEALVKLAEDGVSAAESSPEDPCHDIAPDQGKEVFRQGIYEPDMDKFLDRIQECLDSIKKEFPKIRTSLRKEMFWSQSFCLLTTGGATVDIIKQYIQSQGKKDGKQSN